MLGIVAAPDAFPDVTPDSNGMVQLPTLMRPHGMSTAPTIVDLPRFRRPVEWGGTQKSSVYYVWMIAPEDLGADLIVLHDSPGHAVIGPARTMSLSEFREALAKTQVKWIVVRPP